MATLVLGSRPDGLNLVLTPGAPFSQVIEAAKADGQPYVWPDGTEFLLDFEGADHDWSGLVDGARITFTATAAQVAEVSSGAVVSLVVINGSDRIPLAIGRVTK